MVKERKKKIKNKKNTPNKEPIPKVNKFKEIIISIFAAIYGFAGLLVGLFIIIGVFTGFKYPWKWIDALYETENERFGLLGVNQTSWVPISSLDWYAPHSYVLGE